MTIYGIPVDFIQFRSEIYTSESVIPIISDASAKDDAFRRDLTINSLSYNLNKNAIEDLTELGINDLQNKIIRTPLDPYKTFLDDPIRILRSIRFASRFNFVLVPEIISAIKNNNIKMAFLQKVTREKISKEISGIMGTNASIGMKYIIDNDLFNIIFDYQMTIISTETFIKILDTIYKRKHFDIFDFHLVQLSELNYSALIDLFLDYSSGDIHKMSNYLVVGLKMKLQTVNIFKSIIICAYEFTELIINNSEKYDRSQLGIILRKAGEYWIQGLYFSLIKQLKDFDQIYPMYKKIYETIIDMNLINIWLMKPLINGKELVELFQIKPGQWIADILNQMIRWQLIHPLGNKNECIEWLNSMKNDSLIVI